MKLNCRLIQFSLIDKPQLKQTHTLSLLWMNNIEVVLILSPHNNLCIIIIIFQFVKLRSENQTSEKGQKQQKSGVYWAAGICRTNVGFTYASRSELSSSTW